MPTTVRLATFNVENLFDRPKLLNLHDQAKGDAGLADLRALQTELGRAQYDKPTILKLYKGLKPYVAVVEIRGKKLFNQGATKVIANGVGDWDGWLSLKRDQIWPEARANTARVIADVNADAQCVVEVDSRPLLQRFNSQEIPKAKRFEFNMLIDGNDDRGIDVGILSRLPIRELRSHIADKDNAGEVFSRDCLEVRLELAGGGSLWMLLNHFKSKGYSGPSQGNDKRLRQAKQVAKILADRFNLATDLVVVCGDLNDTPDSAPLAPLLGVPNLFDVLALQFPNAADRWSYHYKKNEQIDYLLVSKPLRDAFVTAGVERRGMFEVDKFSAGAIAPYREVTSDTVSASDHGAVWADFNL
jgi:endonuclease/exonuclease/phosphatase family metal-dependent hydrolase